MSEKERTIGYLPDERPPFGKLLLYAIQQIIVMFPATVTVALITNFHISTTIFASGLATICFLFITGRKIPLYYGSSFSYLSAILGIMAAKAAEGADLNTQISYAQFGIIMSGIVSIVAGLLVNLAGRNVIEKILPPTITGPIAMVIGLTLASNALNDAASIAIDSAGTLAVAESEVAAASNYAWICSFVTLISTIILSVYLKGFWGQLPLLFGPIIGCLVALVIYLITGVSLFRVLPSTANSGIFALPEFTLPKPSWEAVAAIMPIAIATIPESSAHIYQLDIYVNKLAKDKKSNKTYNIADLLGRNLIGDGLGDMISAAVGGPAGTNYGENISAMAITRVFSVPVLMVASILAMVISCFTPLINAIYAIPTSVIGGLEIFLFGAIAAQGIAIMIDKKSDMFDPKNIAVIATIMIIGIGGNYGFPNGTIPFFGVDVPCIAGAAIFGIVLNLLLSIGEKKKENKETAQD
ncbi:MAG: xanthine permease [Clostridia bacterium]|nr:xanthine permease [Clostridia bacterium]